jgi:transcription elongation factor S-II
MRTITDPTIFRSDIVKKLNALIKKRNISINLERGIFNYTIKEATKRKIVKKWDNKFFVILYMDKLRSIYLNLDCKSSLKNIKLLKALKGGEFKAHELASMKPHEMFKERWQDLIDAKIERDTNATKVKYSAATDEFTCRRCRKKKCTYYEMQTRSADEPMTIFVTCLGCANRWRC